MVYCMTETNHCVSFQIACYFVKLQCQHGKLFYITIQLETGENGNLDREKERNSRKTKVLAKLHLDREKGILHPFRRKNATFWENRSFNTVFVESNCYEWQYWNSNMKYEEIEMDSANRIPNKRWETNDGHNLQWKLQCLLCDIDLSFRYFVSLTRQSDA